MRGKGLPTAQPELTPDPAARKRAGPAATVVRSAGRGEVLTPTLQRGVVRAENPRSCLLWGLACTETGITAFDRGGQEVLPGLGGLTNFQSIPREWLALLLEEGCEGAKFGEFSNSLNSVTEPAWERGSMGAGGKAGPSTGYGG